MNTLKDELVGAWKLLSYIEVPIDGLDSLFPLGKTPRGLLIYTTDGYMSVQIAKEGRLPFQSNDKLKPDLEEMKDAVQGYLAFTGKYKVDNKQAIVHYVVSHSLYPNWDHSVMSRHVNLEGDVLYMKSTEPSLSNGHLVNSYMTWQRIGANMDTTSAEHLYEALRSV